MAYKRLSRKDYQRLIGIANDKKQPKARRRRKIDQRGGITVPGLLLTKMISNDNRSWVQRDAKIDTMNVSSSMNVETCRYFLNSHTKLPAKTIKFVLKNQEIVKAITEHKVPISTKKRIFKQKGGILPNQSYKKNKGKNFQLYQNILSDMH